MDRLFHRIDSKLSGWLTTCILIFLEIVIVYLVSNMPFVLATLDIPIVPGEKIGFTGKFIQVLQNEINKGQLLTFVCALIAPVVFWSLIEFKKALRTKVLSVSSLILIALSAYVHGTGKEFSDFGNIYLYWAAIIVWVLYILSYRIPPENNYVDIENKGTDAFVAKTQGLDHG